jgi:hypothetical protein
MDEHDIDMIQQAATRLHAEQWHDNAFLLRLAAEVATTDYERYWLGRDAADAERYATAVDRHAAEVAKGNDPLDEWEIQQGVQDCRDHAGGSRLPTTVDGWEHPGPPPWSDTTRDLARPPTSAWPDSEAGSSADEPDDDLDWIDDRAPGPGQIELWSDDHGALTVAADAGRKESVTDAIRRADEAIARIDAASADNQRTELDQQRGERIARWQADDIDRDIGWEASS